MRRSAVAIVAGLLLLGLTWAARTVGTDIASMAGDPLQSLTFVGLLALSVVCYFVAAGQMLQLRLPPLWVVLGVAVLLRVVTLFMPPVMSSDIYRYVWDGMVQQAGINPYLHIPADAALAFLRDSAIYPHINRADYAPTIYPPAAQMVFAAVGLVPSLISMKLAMVGFEALAVACLIALLGRAGLPRAQVMIYAWNPLAVWEFAGNGHVDAVAVGLVALALLLRCQARDGWAGVAFSAAVLVKFLPVAIGPALWRRGGAARLVGCGLLFGVALYAVYAVWGGAGWKVLGFLTGYEQEEGLSTGAGLWPLAGLAVLMPLPTWLPRVYLALVATGLAALALRIIARRHAVGTSADVVTVCGDASVLAVCAILALTPHYAWYYGWLGVAATVRPSRVAIWLGCAAMLLAISPAGNQFAWPALLFVPALALAWMDLRQSRQASLLLQTAQGGT